MTETQPILNEKDLKKFKPWLKSMLSSNTVTVTFTKKDGSERVMKCTTSPGLVPRAEPSLIKEEIKDKKPRKQNEDVCNVFDLETNAWKSFRWDSVKRIQIEI